MELGLAGKRAIVLGGSRGIGFFVAKLLRAEGASVALCARDAAGVNSAVAQLGGDTFGQSVDLVDAQATRAFVQQAVDQLGGLDVLIHNASGFGVSNTEEDWERSFAVDVMAGVRAVDVALPALQASGAGSIVFVGSMASKFHFGRPPSPYGAVKAAMRTYANELAQNYGKDGIRANVVSPGACLLYTSPSPRDRG